MQQQKSFNPWATVWTNPRQTVRNVLATNPTAFFALLAAGGGIGQACNLASSIGLGQSYTMGQILAFVLLTGSAAGLMSVYLWSFLLTVVGRRFGSVADAKEVRVAVAWSWAPAVYLLPMWGVRYILFRDELFLLQRPIIEASTLLTALHQFFGLYDLLLSFYALFILCQTVSEVSALSVWKSMIVILAVLLLMMLPAMFLFGLLATP